MSNPATKMAKAAPALTACKATVQSITVFFSEAVQGVNSNTSGDATNPASYQVYDPTALSGPLAGTAKVPPAVVPLTSLPAQISYDPERKAATILFQTAPFSPGDWVTVFVNGINPAAPSGTAISAAIGARVNGDDQTDSTRQNIREVTEAVEDAVSYPMLTEDVGYPPGPISGAGAGVAGAPAGAPAKGNLTQAATQAITDALGWKMNPNDPAGFVGALSQSFTLTGVDGHTQATWVPRSYAVQTDLAGGITGAQASLLYRMKDGVDQSLPLIDGLMPLRRDPDWEYINAAKAIVKSQLQEIINELSLPGSLRVARVDEIFSMLFQPAIVRKGSKDGIIVVKVEGYLATKGQIEVDPDLIGGQMGELRLQLGLRAIGHDYPDGRKEPGNLVNTIEDEVNQTNFRMVVDYITSIWLSWLNNRQYFELPTPPHVQPFFGTQLVLISRALSVVAEKVNELRFALDSVFIGPAERQALELHFPETITLLNGKTETVPSKAMFLEDLLNWVYSFSTDEGPRLIQTAGRYGVKDSFFPVAKSLRALVLAARGATNGRVPGFKTARVRRATHELESQLNFLVDMVKPIESPMELPPAP